MQEQVDKILKQWRQERSATQMTLIQLIEAIKKFNPERRIKSLGNPHSYRGYYSDLSFEFQKGTQSCGDFLLMLKQNCLGATFTGYKGGDFYMDEDTPLWIAKYGYTGQAIIDLEYGDSISFKCKEEQ